MDKFTLTAMQNFTPDALTEIYINLYNYEYGEKKVREVISKVEGSDKINKYISILLISNKRPSIKDIETLLNSISYFIFSKEETLCLGGLATIILWRNFWIARNGGFDNATEDFDSQALTICIALIEDCYKNKFNKGENFFTRFYKKINQIGFGENNQ
ncbi:MAG: hypothetical protein KF763_19125 [Cyclobacteriaceae bacterium]|nr:hypothetical protein [Cyclobacteriaceae bacterium]